jgi:hypothetical protein
MTFKARRSSSAHHSTGADWNRLCVGRHRNGRRRSRSNRRRRRRWRIPSRRRLDLGHEQERRQAEHGLIRPSFTRSGQCPGPANDLAVQRRCGSEGRRGPGPPATPSTALIHRLASVVFMWARALRRITIGTTNMAKEERRCAQVYIRHHGVQPRRSGRATMVIQE